MTILIDAVLYSHTPSSAFLQVKISVRSSIDLLLLSGIPWLEVFGLQLYLFLSW